MRAKGGGTTTPTSTLAVHDSRRMHAALLLRLSLLSLSSLLLLLLLLMALMVLMLPEAMTAWLAAGSAGG
jgi:hypothetical protein